MEEEQVLVVPIVISLQDCRELPAPVMESIIDDKLKHARRAIAKELGLNDGTYELSQDLQ